MNGNGWRTAFVALVAGTVGALLATVGTGLLPSAHAQGDGAAGSITCVVGPESSGDLPIILVDAAEQTLLIYQYDYSSEDVELMAARSIRYDRLLTEYNIEGASVSDVMKEVRKQR